MTNKICPRCGYKLKKKKVKKSRLTISGPIGPGSPDVSKVRPQSWFETIYVCSNPDCPYRQRGN